jgi:hypothetical protein
MVGRKPILLLDDSAESNEAIDLFRRSGIEYTEYNIKKFEESCCGEMLSTKAPSVFAVEGLFKHLEKINEYIILRVEPAYSNIESESAYW